MLRIWRIVGIVVCALMVGLAVRSLFKAGDRSQVDIAILIGSFLSFAVLGYFELTHVVRKERRHRHHRYTPPVEKDAKAEFASGSTGIYAMPETLGDWKKERRSSHSSGSRRRGKKVAGAWMSGLRFLCVVMPLVYVGFLIFHLPWDGAMESGDWLSSSVFFALFLFSVVVGAGVFSMRVWGLVLGYLLVLCNLPLFPYGTAIGLLLLLCLVGSSPIFFAIARGKHRGIQRSR